MAELDAETREQLLDELARWIAHGGPARFLRAPAEPCERAFPEPWKPTRAGVRALLRRLAWHAGLDGDADPSDAVGRTRDARSIAVDARLHGAPPTQRRPETSLELLAITRGDAVFALYFIGEDDVPGTFAHELGVWFAALHPEPAADPVTPYRDPREAAACADEVPVDPERDLERGSRACVYLGLGVLAANAAYQQYSRSGRFNGGYSPLEYDVVQAGYVPMSELAFLLAVQAAVRGDREPPAGLGGPQRDEVSAHLARLHGQRAVLRARLGIPADAPATARPAAEPFDVDLFADEAIRKDAFRLRTHRGGVGALTGGVLGAGVALLVASRGLAPLAVVGVGVGHVAGRRMRATRCTACASITPVDAPSCSACGAVLRATIDSAAERLDK